MPMSVEKRILAALEEFSEVLKGDEPISSRLLVRRVEVPRAAIPVASRRVKKARETLGANAALLGVSAKTVKAWEDGIRTPRRMACRFMQEIQQQPDLFRSRLKQLAG